MKFFGRYGGIEYYHTSNFLYAKKDGELYKLALFDKHFYKLRLYNRVPILEIDGVRMHLVKNFSSPLDYAREVAKQLHLSKNDVVLDTCMGLGYTAMEAAKYTERVVTCELHRAVVQLAKWNPFSKGLFTKNIEIQQGDVASLINWFKDKTLDAIIHDPPRFSHAPQLYSSSFYRELFRICKKRARLFHYVGSVGKNIKGRSIENEVSKRLEVTGFKDIRYIPRLQGLIFKKF